MSNAARYLLPPLAFGMPQWQYEGGAWGRQKARSTEYGRLQSLLNPLAKSKQPAAAGVALARAHGLDPAQMALAFSDATAVYRQQHYWRHEPEQLDSNIASAPT